MPTQQANTGDSTPSNVTTDANKVELHYVGDVVKLIEAMIAGPVEMLQKHGQSLVGPRTRGSTCPFGLADLNLHLSIEEVHPNVEVIQPECRYYILQLNNDMGMKLGAVRLKDLVDSDGCVEGVRMTYMGGPEKVGIPAPVTLRRGKHGYEFFVDVPKAEARMVGTDFITIITEEYPGFGTVVSTWHPGPVMGTGQRGVNDYTAVKLHNG